jgi:hypothetical protein
MSSDIGSTNSSMTKSNSGSNSTQLTLPPFQSSPSFISNNILNIQGPHPSLTLPLSINTERYGNNNNISSPASPNHSPSLSSLMNSSFPTLNSSNKPTNQLSNTSSQSNNNSNLPLPSSSMTSISSSIPPVIATTSQNNNRELSGTNSLHSNKEDNTSPTSSPSESDVDDDDEEFSEKNSKNKKSGNKRKHGTKIYQ